MINRVKKITTLFVTLIMWVGLLWLLPLQTAAQLTITNPGASDTNTGGFGLGEIQIPTFLSLDQVAHFSILSYVGVLLTLVFIAVLLLWVYLVLKSSVEVMRSQGDEGAIEGSKKRITNVLVSISILFAFLIGITLVGSFFGVGNFWQWPKSFSLCKDEETYYFRYALENADSGMSTEQLETKCFGATK